MDHQLFSKIFEETPKFNPRLANNICTEMMEGVEELIYDSFKASEKDYPESLKFVKIERPDPWREYKEAKRNGQFEITKNSIYMVLIHFEFDGQPLGPFPLYLPYCYKGGLMILGGSMFSLAPVMIDPCLSITNKNIFLSVNKDKLTFSGTPHHYMENGERRNEQVVYSKLYRGGKRGTSSYRARTYPMNSVLVHYLLARYGFKEVFSEFFGLDEAVIGFEDVNPETYPAPYWTIASSVGEKPNTFKSKFYTPTRVNIAIPTNKLTNEIRSLLAGFFYIADHFPERFRDAENVEDAVFYQRLLATVIQPYEASEIRAFNDLHGHLNSLATYIDERVRKRFLTVEGIALKDIYDLFVMLVKTYQNRLTITVDQLTTMYDKRLVILPYVLEGIIYDIYKLGFDLQPMKKDPNFNAAKATNKISHRLQKLRIIKLNNARSEVTPASTATDNLITKISSPVVPQSSISNKKGGGGNKKVINLASTLSPSIAEVGDITSPAGCATGRSRLNMMAQVDEEGNIVRKEHLRELIDSAQDNIAR